MIGGSGNDTLTSTGGSSITLFGGTGNDSLSSSGGTSVSVIGGSGNDTLSSTGGSNVTLQGGGAGNDSLTSSGGTSVTMFGGAGNDTLSANGGTGIGLYGLEGNNVYNIVGPITVALNDLGTFGQQQPQTDSLTPGINTIAFPGLTTGITLDLSNTSPGPAPLLPPTRASRRRSRPASPCRSPGNSRTSSARRGTTGFTAARATNVLDGGGSGNDTLVAGTGPATLVAGSGNDSLVAGTGGTTFRFAGARATSATSPSIRRPADVLNMLDFSQFGGPVSLNLGLDGLANRQRRLRFVAEPESTVHDQRGPRHHHHGCQRSSLRQHHHRQQLGRHLLRRHRQRHLHRRRRGRHASSSAAANSAATASPRLPPATR